MVLRGPEESGRVLRGLILTFDSKKRFFRRLAQNHKASAKQTIN